MKQLLNRPAIRGFARPVTHGALLLITAGTLSAAARVERAEPLRQLATDALGYESFVLLVATLLVGPWYLLVRRIRFPLPVNLSLRRDLGIWVGLTGVAHSVIGLSVHFGGKFSRYFLPRGTAVLSWLPFGASNWLGLAAALLLLLLTMISNDVALRSFGARRWKRLQQSSYIVALLVLLHTIGYQVVLQRTAWLVALVAVLTGVVLLAQLRARSHTRRAR